jgi:glycosyltransferase involved in cell wall biosynthesis
MSRTPVHKPPVIMQVIPHLGAGGAEQGCIDIAAELVKSKAKAIIVSNGGMRVPELSRLGVIHIDLPVHSKNPVTMWRNISRLRKLIRVHGVDIVHARSRAPAWSCLKACDGTSAHFMTTCHAPYNIHESAAKRFYNSSIARGERVIAISDFVAEYLKKNYKIDPAVIRTVHRGIPVERFNPTNSSPERIMKLTRLWRIPDGASVILMPGRLTRWKGQIQMIEAMALLNDPDVYCVMVGDDQGRTEYREELEDLLHDLKIDGNVRIMEHCDDMPAAYMLSAAVVSASIEPEGFGRIAVEGQAMGRPVIATDHGGSTETVIPGVTGWLVPPGDAEALADALKKVLALTEDQRNQLAHLAIEHINQNFTKVLMANRTLDVYTELLQGQPASRNAA